MTRCVSSLVIEFVTDENPQAKAPLEAIQSEANTLLLKEAHETILSVEKEVLDTGGNSEGVTYVQQKLTTLKNVLLQPTWVKAELHQAIEDVRFARAKMVAKTEKTAEQLAQEAKIVEIQKLNAAAEAAKADLLGLTTGVDTAGVAAADAAVALEGLIMTHTATAVAMTTHVVWVMETATIQAAGS